MFLGIDGNLNSPDEPFAGVVVGGIVQRLQTCKQFYQVFRVLFLQFRPQLGIRRHVRKRITAGGRFDIQAGPSAKYGHSSPFPYVFINLLEIPLILIDIVFAARVGYIYKMDRNLSVFLHILARAYIHTPVNLTRVRRNDFSDSLSAQAVDFPCKRDGVTSLSRSSGSENAHKVCFTLEVGIQDGTRVNGLGLGKFCH